MSQIYRWYSWRPALGFIDFMKLRLGLKAVIAWALLDTFMAVFFTGVLLYFLLIGKWGYVVMAAFLDWGVYAIVSAHEGYKVGKFWDALDGLPNCMLLRYVNIVVLLAALIRPKKKWY